MSAPELKELFVGTYGAGTSAGLHGLVREGGVWRVSARTPTMANASFAVYGQRHALQYIVEEEAEGRVGAYQRDPKGEWRQLARSSTEGSLPCFVDISLDGAWLAVANYMSGSTAFFSLDLATGLPSPLPDRLFVNSGGGPNTERQAGPHAHCVRFTAEHAYSVDLGGDLILGFPLTTGAAIPDPFIAFRMPPGEGPRHIVFHPRLPRAYAITELGNKVFVLALEEGGQLREVQRISTLPTGFSGTSIAAHIQLNADADRLYASNRGHDSLAVFAVAADGRLQLMQIAPTHGASPRHFVLLSALSQILVAHENGGGVTILALKETGGVGAFLQRLPIPRPCFIFPG